MGKFIKYHGVKALNIKKNSRLYQLRSASKITQQELSNKTGIHLSSIKMIESGSKSMVKIKLRTAYLFSKALNCSINDLIDVNEIDSIYGFINNGIKDNVSNNYYKLFSLIHISNLTVEQNLVISQLLRKKNIKKIAITMNCTTFYIVSMLDYARVKYEKRKISEIGLMMKYMKIFKFSNLSILSPSEQDIVFLLFQDLTPREIALFYNKSYSSVCRILHSASIKVMTNETTENIKSTNAFIADYLTYFRNVDISTLPQIYKEVVILFVGGNTIPHIAATKGYSIHNVKSLLCDARIILSGMRTIISINLLKNYTDLFIKADLSVLTRHQMEIVSLLLEGMTINEIAFFLNQGIYHVRSILQRAKEKILYHQSNCK